MRDISLPFLQSIDRQLLHAEPHLHTYTIFVSLCFSNRRDHLKQAPDLVHQAKDQQSFTCRLSSILESCFTCCDPILSSPHPIDSLLCSHAPPPRGSILGPHVPEPTGQRDSPDTPVTKRSVPSGIVSCPSQAQGPWTWRSSKVINRLVLLVPSS